MSSEIVPRDSVQCKAQRWIRILQILCNLVLSLIGKGGLALAILAKIGFCDELMLLDHYENVNMSVFLGLSVILIAIGWFGIFAGSWNCHWSSFTNALLLGGFMVTSTVYVATTGVLTNYKTSGKLYEQMTDDIKNYDKHKDVIDTLQATLLCCGLNNVKSWNTSNFPKSCCREMQKEGPCILGSIYLQTNGCFEAFLRTGRYYAWILFTVVAACGLLEILGIILSHLRYQIIKHRTKEKSATGNLLKTRRTGTSKMQNEKENNKKETKEGKIKENSGKETAKLAEKSEETQMSKKNNVETNTCRNICKEFGRNILTIHFY